MTIIGYFSRNYDILARTGARENSKPTRHYNPDAPTAVPAAVLFNVGEDDLLGGRVRVHWSFNNRLRKWTVEFPIIEPETPDNAIEEEKA